MHRIRLSARWTLTRDGIESKIDLPTILNGSEELTRNFGRPANLNSEERVWLVLELSAELWTANLNSEDFTSTEMDVTERLRERNELRLYFPNGGELKSAHIEIRRP